MGLSILARPIGWPFVVCYAAFIVGEFILTRPTRGRPDQRDRGTFYAYMAVMAVSFSLNFGHFSTDSLSVSSASSAGSSR